MFTGIIQAVGKISRLEKKGGDIRIGIDTGALEMATTQLGDSIAVNGICLTVIEMTEAGFFADVSNETLAHTNLASLKVGTAVNLEKALTLSTPLGGHLVSGHVDGVGEVKKIEKDARSVRIKVKYPKSLAKYIAAKGSITVDGVSLTVNSVDDEMFTLNIVPHTADCTIISGYKQGQKVHLEIDLIARYVERMMNVEQSQQAGSVTMAKLASAGFLK